MRPRMFLALLLLLVATLAGCRPGSEERSEAQAEAARAALRVGLERGDRSAALAAVEKLRESLPDTADSHLETARAFTRAGDASRAGWLLEEGVQRFPDRDDLRLALGRISLLLGNPARAREAVLPIAKGSEQHAAALVTQAQAELQLGDLEPALETLATAESLYPEQPEARLVRIATLLSERRQDEARAAIEEARAVLRGDDEETVAVRRRLDMTLAQIQAQQGEPDAALAALDALLAEEPNDVLVWRATVQVLVRSQRAPEAQTRLEAALAGDESPDDLYALLAQVHASQGNDAEAEAALRTLVARSESPAAVLPLFEFHSARGNAEAARAVLDEALEGHPGEAVLRSLRIEALLAEAVLDEARAELTRFREATFAGDPRIAYVEARLLLAEGEAGAAAGRLRELAPELDTAATQFWLGRALEESGDFEGARRRYALAARRDRSWTAPAVATIALEQRRGNWRAVAAQARRLVQQAPQELIGWSALVEALERVGEGEAAEQVARQSLERFPESGESEVLLARALRAQGDIDGALAALDRAGARGETTQRVAERIFTLGIGGRVAAGVAAAEAAIAGEPDAALLHAAHASLLFAAGDVAAGDAATERALVLDPDEPRPLRVRCEFRAASRNWTGARTDCERYLDRRPEDAGMHFVLGVALQSLGENDRAAAAYRRAAALDEREVRARNNLAELLAGQGDVDGALRVAQEAYRLDAENPYLLDTLGALYLRKELGSRAVPLLEKAHAGLPEHAGVALNLVRAYRDTARVDEARALLDALETSVAPGDPLRAQLEEARRTLP